MDERTTSGEFTGSPVPGPDESAVPAGVQPGTRNAGSGEAATMEALQADVARLTEDAQRNWEQFLRTAADLENYRKQAIRQREEAVSAARRVMLHVILGVVDTL